MTNMDATRKRRSSESHAMYRLPVALARRQTDGRTDGRGVEMK
jgi:hypothetical protein